jgi:hypothetical protein
MDAGWMRMDADGCGWMMGGEPVHELFGDNTIGPARE